jgi:molybdenum cofactor synthesis domain-containing protein
MKSISVYEAEGTVLCHDITEIVPGKFKGRAFKKGHVVRKEDIPKLLQLGKEHLYVWEINEQLLHENEGALKVAQAVAGMGIILKEPAEGKVELVAQYSGLVKVSREAVDKINEVDQVVLATIFSNRTVKAGQLIAGCRIIPLVIDASKVDEAARVCRFFHPVIEVRPLCSLKVGIVTTGSEVYHGRIQDQFGPVLTRKFQELNCEVVKQIFVPDNVEMISNAIHELLNMGVELITTTGGMSVDPDDLTPTGIVAAGGRVVSYGAPTLPGSMFMLANIGNVPVLGLPGCVMYHKTTIFDLVIPRILTGEEVTRKDIQRLGYGGLCMGCTDCRFPDCAFGQG